MTIEQIRDVARALPFQPFELETTGGQRIRVEHPDYIFFVPGSLTITVYSKAQDVVRLVNVNHVASMEIKTPANT